MKYPSIKKHLEKVYDELSGYWGTDATLHDWGGEELKSFANLVKKNHGKNVLDLGCGSGVQSKQLLEEGLSVIGMDLSRNMVEEAKKRAPSATFMVGDIAYVTFARDTFDGIYARASLLHIPKNLIQKVLKSLNRILKTGGVLYLALKEGKGEGEVEDVRHGINVKRFFSFFVKEEIEKLLDNAGFKILELKTYTRAGGSTTWIQVLSKKS